MNAPLRPSPETATAAFVAGLNAVGWNGTIRTDRAARVVLSTDNSIYQRLPQAVIEPRDIAAMAVAMTLAAKHGVAITARGGGTGTNGQSLTDAVVMDCSRHLNRIIEIDAETGVAVIEPGVVLDQLNAVARPLGWMCGPTVSTATRATLGGMVSTDASGKGSRRFGRTSDHLECAEVIWSDGSRDTLRDLRPDELDAVANKGGTLGRLITLLRDDLPAHSDEIDRVFPAMNRGLTGFNLKQVQRADGGLALTRLLAGSEGTLALIGRITLRLSRVPLHKGAAVIGYSDCDAALRAVPDLLVADPDAIEFLDDKVLRLGRGAAVWEAVAPILGDLANAGGLLFAEVSGETPEDVTTALDAVAAAARASRITALGVLPTQDSAGMAALATLRSEAVGLLASGDGPRRGVPFVEDAAVPPEHLVEFVREFSALLDAQGLEYGMFGHADVGCVHVRPMLDMLSDADRARIRPISDAVAALTQRHGGLIWGEHGKGVRGEYLEGRVGPVLFSLMGRIKTACDPANLLNPGKLVQADGATGPLLKIDTTPFRGEADAKIPADARRDFAPAIACNGNGACFDWSPARTMCPSFKATGDRLQSPKGRAALIRDWQRHLADDPGGAPARAAADALATTLDTCLSCKSCTSLCPIRVDIPEMKAQFLHRHHATTHRPRRDHLVRWMERLTLLARHLPRLSNLAMSVMPWRIAALCDLPSLTPIPAERALRQAGAVIIAPDRPRLSAPAGQSAILITDSFLGVFDTGPLLAAARIIAMMGVTVHATPPIAMGKALQVRGFLDAFHRVRDTALLQLKALAATGAPLVVVEPAVLMALRQEWPLADHGVEILSLEQFLHGRRGDLPASRATAALTLLPHCTQASGDPGHTRLWQEIFAHCGLKLTVESVGCCGMAGLFGHEAEHKDMSRDIFDLSWRGPVTDKDRTVVATGFSCRCQTARFAGHRPDHPVEALAKALTG
ncbi:FAD-binding and (Fe-S)-binding domain-containing protein [Oceaniovalibus sp. ACAM 378]|uniref:FAD-binding and (Fe-S)-binding domain-containing protein n=1 Tax=Oceaniovalibus sp. ACAM 378 TaxID=2599923 RepID=UPI001651BA20|nr:FAD-binding and (Fe-S)-binding domain-containing protein [Oceaniovalibus sp. ACAM 378]